MTAVDVEIHGGGIFGLAIAWSCRRLGATVRIVESRRIGAGASGGPGEALAPHAPDGWNSRKQFQLESLLMAKAWWGDIRESSGIDPGYCRSGRLQPVPDRLGRTSLEQERARQAGRNWMRQASWLVETAAGDWMPASPTGLVVRDTLSARLHPVQALRCLASALRNSGCKIIEGDAAARDAGARVWATGIDGLRHLNRTFGRQIGTAEKGQAMLLAHDARHLPQIFGDGVHVVPHFDGTAAIGSTSEREFDVPLQVDGRLDDLHRRATRLVPAIAGAPVIARWAGIRPRAVTRAPLLGPFPGKDGNFIANGGFKIGLGIAPGVGTTMAELILEGRDRIPPEFRLEPLLDQPAATPRP